MTKELSEKRKKLNLQECLKIVGNMERDVEELKICKNKD